MSASCGSCSLCCRLMRIEAPELTKPAGEWCQHCTPGKGCGIYEQRPEPCRTFECLWLKSQSRKDPAERLPPELKPERSHVVLSITQDGENLIVLADPKYPGAWRQPAVMKLVERITKGGKMAFLVEGGRRAVIDAWREE